MSKIIFYTCYACPWAQRVHITLAELGLEFEEVQIDLNKPREPWYLEINPRGTVPSMKYNGEIIPESGIMTQLLVDANPSHLAPPTGNFEGALKRARISYFVDTFVTKVIPPLFGAVRATSEEEKAEKANAMIEVIEKEITPLLKGAGPFFGGSSKLTLAEVNIAPFALRIKAFGKEGSGILPAFALEKLSQNKTWQNWVDALLANKNVTAVFDEDSVIQSLKAKLAELAKAGTK